MSYVAKFLVDIFGFDVVEHEANLKLPIYLKDRYFFVFININKVEMLLAVNLKEEELPYSSIAKDFKTISEKVDAPLVYVSKIINNYNRKKFIENGFSFIHTDKQVYLIPLAALLRELPKKTVKVQKVFSPVTQVLVIYILINNIYGNFNVTEIYEDINNVNEFTKYSKVSISRAFDEIDKFKVAKIKTSGRDRYIELLDLSDFWLKSQKFLQTPVIKAIHTRDNLSEKYLKSGYYALSEYSNLAESNKIYLVARNQKKNNNNDYLVQIADYNYFSKNNTSEGLKNHYSNQNGSILELWRYYPPIKGHIADRISIYLSLKDDKDERVQGALNDMMEHFQWFRG